MTPPAARLGWPQLLLALGVVVVWGSNFVVIKLALGHLPPLLFAALRFALVAVPLVLFLKRPSVPLANLAAYGCLIGVGQFGVLYVAMNGQITPGLASIVVQAQVFFTILLAVVLNGERFERSQAAGLLLALGGLGVIVLHVDRTTTLTGLGMVLVAALSWGSANIVQRRAGRVPMLAYVVWSGLFAVPPLILLSLLVEGPARIGAALAAAGAGTWGAVLWQSVGNTMFGYGAWGWLLARYPASTISPLALLVPVFGMGTAAFVMAEPLPAWKLLAAGMIIGGLALNLLLPRALRAWRPG